MEVIRETLWKRCLSTPTKPPAKNSNICLSETAYQHKGTRKKCKKTIQAAIIQWQRKCLMYKPQHIASPDRSRKQANKRHFLAQSQSTGITPFCSDALVWPPNLYPPCFLAMGLRSRARVWSSARKPLLITWSWTIKLSNQLRRYTRYNSQI